MTAQITVARQFTGIFEEQLTAGICLYYVDIEIDQMSATVDTIDATIW